MSAHTGNIQIPGWAILRLISYGLAGAAARLEFVEPPIDLHVMAAAQEHDIFGRVVERVSVNVVAL